MNEREAEPHTISLGGDWRFRGFLGDEWRWARLGERHDDWLPGRVPGSVVDDLRRAGELPDPTWERNSRLCEWVPQRSWAYQREIQSVAGGTRVQLRFEGIDPSGSVWLDGHRLGRAPGMYRPWTFELDDRVADGKAHLLGVILDPAPRNEPQVGDTRRVREHRPRMVEGWDFCPRLPHQGIWEDVSLRITGPARLEQPFARSLLSGDLRRGELRFEALLDSAGAADAELTAKLSLDGDVVVARSVRQSLPAGQTPMSLSLPVDEPQPWWPNGAGDQPLYRMAVTVLIDGNASDSWDTRVGFRRVELVANEGPASAPPYTFVVNGRRMYVNGWNWVPIDISYGVPRPGRERRLVELARRAGVNLLRVWGGGLIERDSFYDRCDEAGIMVWQEFSQSSSSIVNRPSRSAAFVRLMADEAAAIIPRRRNHPSLVAWCGGNELTDLDGRTLDDREPVLAALHEQVVRLDSDRLWFPTSPLGPEGNNSLAAIRRNPDGLWDVHGPWEHQGLGDHEPLYDAGTALFHSEFGVEGMAHLATVEATIAEEHRWPATRANVVWSHRGAWWINEPLVQRTFGGIGDLPTLIRASQYLQASGLAYAIEANRRRQWRSAGVIPWQLNEPFPNGYCTSAVDYSGRPKPAYHAVATAYRALALSARHAGQALAGDRLAFQAWAANADPRSVAARLTIRAVDAAGTELARSERDVEIPAGRAACLDQLDWRLPAAAGDLVLLSLGLEAGADRVLAERRYLFSATSDLAPMLRLARTELAADYLTDDDAVVRLRLENRGEWLALLARVEDPRPPGGDGSLHVSDNDLLLLPGERVELDVIWEPEVPAAERSIRVSAWNAPEVLLA